MFKKLLLVGVIAVAAVAVLKGTKFFGYAKQEVASLREAIDDQIPVEKKIAQMRKEVNALDGDIEKVKNELATSIVNVRDLTTKTAKVRAGVETEHQGLVARGEALKDATEKVKVGGAFVPVGEAKEQLKRDVQIHVKRKAQMETMEKMLSQQERIKETLEKQFDQLLRQKEELKAEIDAVEAEYKALQLQQIESKYQTDDTRLAKVKESLRGLRHKLDIEKESLKLTPKAIEGTSPASTESVDEILAPLTVTKKAE